MKLDLTSLKKAITSFKEAISFLNSEDFKKLDNSGKNTVIAGVIQNFEFTYELCWKFMKRWLENNLTKEEIQGISRKELFRIAKQNGLIDDVDKWMSFHQARNETVHTYDQDKAVEILKISEEFLTEAEKLMFEIQKRND